jgi:hypothetical protein
MRRVFIEILDDGADRAPRPPFSRGQRIEITAHVVANSVSGAPPISTEVSGLPIPPIIVRNGIAVHLESGETEGHVFGVALPGDYLRARLVLGEEASIEAWPHVTFGGWCGVVSPGNPSLGRCVHRDAQDAAPAGFSLIDRAEVANVVRLLKHDASTLNVKDVFGLAVDQERVAVVHDDVYGATLPELAQGDALAGDFHPSVVKWEARSIIPVMNERAHLEPSDVLHVIMPVARELQRWCAAGFVPGFGLGHEIHVTLNGAVRFRPFSPQARDRIARVQHWPRNTGPGWAVAVLVIHAMLPPRARRELASWPEIMQWLSWPTPIPEDVRKLLFRVAWGYGSTPPSLDEVIGALDALQASLPPATPDRLAGLVAGLFPGRVAEEERTRETFAMLDERAFSPDR